MDHRTVPRGGFVVTDTHVYSEPGVFVLGITVTDAAGETATAGFQYVVIFDPNGGFVTGGGSIESPAGAYLDDPALVGSANFGFVSKYKKGANVPTGNTQFRFQAGDLRFHSTEYAWLVVTGNNYAKFKGLGSINNAGEYSFQIWAGDGTGSGGDDTFRIKIWEDDGDGGEHVIYDNGMDQEIDGGSIVVHQ